MRKLFFLKLGGSVITNKGLANTANLEKIDEIANEVHRAQRDDRELVLLLGHGSGSFGHIAASKYHTRDGVNTFQQWQGFADVGSRARALNQIIIERLLLAGVTAISFSPCSSIIANDRKIIEWNTLLIEKSLLANIAPVIYGDVVFDQKSGGTILSTEELFEHLAHKLNPERILLAGLETGVWKDFPSRNELIAEITPDSFEDDKKEVRSSTSPDVTGGMRSKVEEMLSLVKRLPQLEVQIFSAMEPENVYSALMGSKIGTVIRNPGRIKP
ncbi:MAG: hypothetical protein FD147_338 [Chloroflexi bacterium]|nr:MAG: hypothetical protein FD147_338 [Chloroflexota bacterium]